LEGRRMRIILDHFTQHGSRGFEFVARDEQFGKSNLTTLFIEDRHGRLLTRALEPAQLRHQPHEAKRQRQ
jgi:hypothetical protein